MKIAHVITRLIIGGAQENTILTCEGLARRGHDVTLISGIETGPEGSLWPRAERMQAEIIRVPTLRRNVSPINEIRCVRELAAILAERKFDVVHTHSSKAGILGRYAAQRARTPIVVHTIHGMSFNRTQSPLVRNLYRTLERRAARWTDAIVCVADAMTTQSLEAGVGRRSQFTTVRSGMETELYSPRQEDRDAVRAEWGVGPKNVVVGTVARLFRNKGYEHLLAAMPSVIEQCPDAKFVWVGDGANRPEYVAELEKLGIRDRVHLTGLVPPSEIPRLINGFDALVHASLWEGLPRAIVQAALTEVPSVSFDNDGAPEVVIEGETGYIVPVGDTHILAQKLATMISAPEKRRSMGATARSRCLGEFDATTMVEKLDALYHRLGDNR